MRGGDGRRHGRRHTRRLGEQRRSEILRGFRRKSKRSGKTDRDRFTGNRSHGKTVSASFGAYIYTDAVDRAAESPRPRGIKGGAIPFLRRRYPVNHRDSVLDTLPPVRTSSRGTMRASASYLRSNDCISSERSRSRL